jgi:O-6-methylguanine DNA methyltransferase
VREIGEMKKFKDKVTQLIKKIPRGKVVSYKELAKWAGRPKAARAVGNICAQNEKIGIIPCHRVIKNDGKVGKYVLGIEKKERLLQSEGVPIKNHRIDTKYFWWIPKKPA